MLSFVPDFIRSAAAFVVVLGVLVFVHEFGHYIAARWRGVRVETFSIGFGQAITSWTDKSGTVWKLAWLPLGGYVKLHGQERPQDVPPEVRATWVPGETFHDKSVLSRAIVVAAGPIANFVLAMYSSPACSSSSANPSRSLSSGPCCPIAPLPAPASRWMTVSCPSPASPSRRSRICRA